MTVKATSLLDLQSTNPFLSEEDKAAVEAKKKALDALLETKDLARYKIEILFDRGFSPSKPSAGIVSFWESGSKFHGGGDALMHICPGKKLGVSNCEAFIRDAGHGYGFLVCKACNKVWDGDKVYGQIMARLTYQGWAQLVLKYFMRLEMSADIYVKYHPNDLRLAAMREQTAKYSGDTLDQIRSSRRKRIYTLKSILADTAAGADLEGRFQAFIKA
jgi:hypothetical protein